MFTRDELNKYAKALWWGLSTARTNPFSEGDSVLVRYDLDAQPLAGLVFAMLLKKGLNPIPRPNLTPGMEKDFFTLGNDDQLKFVSPGEEVLYSNLNGLISLIAPASLTHLASVDPKKIGTSAVAKKFLRDILEKREQTGDFGWTLCAYPTEALAKSAKLSLGEYAEQIKMACYLDHDDPAARWNEVFKEAESVKAWLNSLEVDTLRVQTENTDLTVAPGEQRRWLGVSGHNIPSFEIFLSPDWRGTKGVYYADQPSYRSGNYVKGVRLEFEEGRVAKINAEEGADFVRKQLAMDEGASRLGEFSLTDKRFSKISTFMANTLFDENFGGDHGNCHVAVGASYSDTFSGDQSKLDQNLKEELGFNDSALHWDLVNTEPKTVTAKLKDGSKLVIYEDGQFKNQ